MCAVLVKFERPVVYGSVAIPLAIGYTVGIHSFDQFMGANIYLCFPD